MDDEALIAEQENIKSLETFIRINTSSDAYSATVTILKHTPEAVFGIDSIKQFLRYNNIAYGLKDEGIGETIEANVSLEADDSPFATHFQISSGKLSGGSGTWRPEPSSSPSRA